MTDYDQLRLQKIQQRINSVLRESPQDRLESRFSPFIGGTKPDFENQLMSAASSGGLDGIEAALNEFDRLAVTEDRGRLRHALLVILTHDPQVAKLGLHIPSLEERSPWKLAPSKKKAENGDHDGLHRERIEQG